MFFSTVHSSALSESSLLCLKQATWDLFFSRLTFAYISKIEGKTIEAVLGQKLISFSLFKWVMDESGLISSSWVQFSVSYFLEQKTGDYIARCLGKKFDMYLKVFIFNYLNAED